MILIIDSSYLCYSSMYALKGLSTKEMQTGVSFGFLNTVLSLAERFHTNEFIFCFDSKRSVRKRIYPEYKANRKDPDPEIKELISMMHPQREALQKEILPAIGFQNIFSQSGYEADDLIASIVMGFDEDFVVISRDNDLHQLLDYCTIYDPQTKSTLNREWFVITHGLEPPIWKQLKAIAGCTSDGVKGIEGFAELTTRKFLLGHMKETDKKYQRLMTDESKAIIDRNLKLVSLPMEGLKPIEELYRDKLSLDGFIDVCQKYNFQSFLNNRLDKWKKFINGEI